MAALALLAIYFFAEVGFCAGALGGEFAGCFSTVAAKAVQSPLHLVGWTAATIGLALAARFSPRRRSR